MESINKGRVTIATRVTRWESGADENCRNDIAQSQLFSRLASHLERQYLKHIQWVTTEPGEAQLVLFVFSKDEMFNLIGELRKEWEELEYGPRITLIEEGEG
jgi:hypothetical protein